MKDTSTNTNARGFSRHGTSIFYSVRTTVVIYYDGALALISYRIYIIWVHAATEKRDHSNVH